MAPDPVLAQAHRTPFPGLVAVLGLGAVFLLLRSVLSLRQATATVSETLRERKAHLQSILDTVLDATVVIDVAGIMLSFNASAVRQFGYSPEEAVGYNVSMLMPAPDRAHATAAYLGGGVRLRWHGADDHQFPGRAAHQPRPADQRQPRSFFRHHVDCLDRRSLCL